MVEKKRNSAFELLRIIAMFMVLILHADFYSLGWPTSGDLHVDPLTTTVKIFFEICSIGAVDLFVLISGWFGIRMNLKSLFKLLYQSFFIITLINVVGIVIGKIEFTPNIVAESMFFSHGWFIISYAGLMLISPVLNSFVDTASEKAYKYLLISLLIFQTYFGCFADSGGFAGGYSIMSFCILYLVARYMRLYGLNLLKHGIWITIFILSLCFVLNVFLTYVGSESIPFDFGLLLYSLTISYTSPFVIVAMLGIIGQFSKIRPFHNKWIDFVSASVFSVYLVHICSEWRSKIYVTICLRIFNYCSGITYLGMILCFMVAVFVFSILVDQIRILSWNIIAEIKVKNRLGEWLGFQS